MSDLESVEKDTGYASIHYNVRLKESVCNLDRRPWFEVQTRTLAQDLWATIEHIVGYKPDRRTAFPVTRYFR
jgi:ppGpp synthetase/RelA/SpoT-type nucleotidyltranferase